MPEFDVEALRARFPALVIEHGGLPVALFDGPGGTQVPDTVIEAVSRYYRESNANHDGPFLTSQRSDAVLKGNVATGVFIGGAVLAATGIVLWITAPSSPPAKAGSARPGRCSSTRCWTRTLPATSRSEAPTRRRSTKRIATGSTRAASTSTS